MRLFPGSTRGSRARNAMSAFIAGLGGVILLELFFEVFSRVGFTPTPYATAMFAAFGFVFFLATTFAVIYLQSERFRISPSRLIRDIAISIFYSVVAFALYYRTVGILPTFDAQRTQTARDFIYFSVVTFSTLGYGDFRPSPDSRLLAASQALLGTVHIGMIVGAAFLTFSMSGRGEKQVRPVPSTQRRRWSRKRRRGR
ncbi:ion channel [Pseudaestuariivita sp.]|uniref:ion channel n=1 Tax=Pseudaestuariivita sp. TaxID=2211669 RepID=UPI0040585BC8